MSKIHSKIPLHRFSLFPLSIDKNHLIADDFYPLASPVCNYTRGTTLTLFWKGGRSKSWKTGHLTWFWRKDKIFQIFMFLKCDNNVWSFESQLQLNCQQIYCLHEISFHFWMNSWTDVFRYKSMKSEKKKQNILTKRACHRSLPIDQYNRYQSNPIYRFLSIDYCGYTTMCCTQTYNHFTTTTFSVLWW